MKDKSTSKAGMIAKVGLVALFAFFAKRTINAGDPITYILPNLLLYTPLRETTRFVWKVLDPHKRLTTPIEHKPIAEINKEDFSLEALEKCTQGFAHPCVVRGLFSDTPASKLWPKKGHLNKKLGEYIVPYIKRADYGTKQDGRATDYFKTIADDILGNKESRKYLFFPVKSRFQFNGSDAGSFESLIEDVNEVVHDELQLSEKIWNGFGTNDTVHGNFFGSQLIMGRGTNSTTTTTGTGWHCAPGNNWFAQVVGAKRWYFMSPEYSALMKPLRGGLVNMMAGSPDMGKLHDYLPLSYGEIRAGDMLYNPDWYWHTIQNREGLSIGCPIREANTTLMFQNNAQYSGVIIMNKLFKAFGIDVGGYP